MIYRRGKRDNFIGLAKIKSIEDISYDKLTNEDAIDCEYKDLQELQAWLEKFFRFKGT